MGAAQRRQLLALDAARLGDRDLAAWFTTADVPGEPHSEWVVDWASGSLVDHRLLRSLTGHGSPVMAVATATVDSRPIAVTGSRDFDKRACIFHGTVIVASIRLWLRS